MGNPISIPKVNFEDVQMAVKAGNGISSQASSSDDFILINTLPIQFQNCLIKNTLPADIETEVVNGKMRNNYRTNIVIYGKNSQDDTVLDKYNQLRSLGFLNVYVYSGGLFEWLLLQDIYGSDLFETTSKTLDHLKYLGPRKFDVKYIT